MAQWGDRDQLSDAPKFTVNADTGQSGQDIFGATPIGTFGVSVAEVAAARGDGKGSVGTGWVLREEGTGGRAGRVTHETLVAMSHASMVTDATDFANTSSEAVANTTGTADDAANLFPDS
jgi:hypothetical protein